MDRAVLVLASDDVGLAVVPFLDPVVDAIGAVRRESGRVVAVRLDFGPQQAVSLDLGRDPADVCAVDVGGRLVARVAILGHDRG